MSGELVLTTLRQMLGLLSGLKIDAAVMGGLAVAVWSHLRNTRVVDLLIGATVDSPRRLISDLIQAGMKPLKQPVVRSLGTSRVMQFSFTPPGTFVDIHVDFILADTEFHRIALARAKTTTFPGVVKPIRVLTCEDLILFKLIAGRMIDLSDVVHLIRLNRESLDRTYIHDWAQRLGLNSQLDAALREADEVDG